MSLLSDALKRQEQLRAHGTDTAQREVAVARPPEVAAPKPPEVAAARPPEVVTPEPPEVTAARPPEVTAPKPPEVAAARPPEVVTPEPLETSRGNAAPNLVAPATQPRRASDPTSPRQQPNLVAPATQPRRASDPISPRQQHNPFLKREREATRRPNHSILLMPILGLIVLLALLFLRREFVSSPSTQVEGQRSKVESPGGPGIVPAATPTDVPKAESSVAVDSNQTQSATVETNRLSTFDFRLSTNAAATTSVAIDSNRTQSAAVETNQLSTFDFRLSTNVAAATPPAAAVEPVVEPPPPKAWPAFTLAGIAVGRERIAILSTGEMLVAGETSTCGVKVEKVSGASVVFSLDGETKTLRKGEHSDKPADSR